MSTKKKESDDSKTTDLQTLLDTKPGFREWVEQTDFTHMLEENKKED